MSYRPPFRIVLPLLLSLIGLGCSVFVLLYR